MSKSRMTEEEKRQNEALSRWINSNETTQDIYQRWERDFAFLLVIFRNRVLEEGFAKYRDMSDKEVEEECKKIADREKENENKRNEDGSFTISMWHDWSERDLINMIKAFAELPSEDRSNILQIRTFLDR